MKRTIFILAGLALLTASCTMTEVVSKNETADKAIGFYAYTAKPTKAAQTDVTTDNFNSFEVTSIGNNAVYFDNVTFTKNASTNLWESDPAYYWPTYALDFYAYNTPATGTFTKEITHSGQTLKYSPSTTLAEQEDLVAACASNQTTAASTSLTFNHYLTQVKVNAMSSNSNYKVEVEGVKLANFAGEGTYTFSDNKMVATAANINSATSSYYSETFTSKELTATAQEVMTDGGNGKWYLIPQTVTAWDQENKKTNENHGTYLALKVKITSNNGSYKVYPATGDEAAWMAVPVPADLKFEQGKKYDVTLDFFGNGGAGYVDPENPGELDGNPSTDDSGKSIVGGIIKFNATVTAWDTVTITISL